MGKGGGWKGKAECPTGRQDLPSPGYLHIVKSQKSPTPIYMRETHEENRPSISIILLILGLVYLMGCLLTYSSYPLSQSPQLDAAENITLASQMASGELPKEPFYRAPLYPFILSVLAPADWRPLMGMLLGFICHLGSGALVFGIARKTWNRDSAACLASALYLLNPASIFYSFQILDITFATTLFLGGVYLLHKGKQSWPGLIAAGALLALSIAARPHFIPVVLALPLILCFRADRKRSFLMLVYAPVVLGFLSTGMINLSRSGDFRVLPWQGSYNLWASNKPAANGVYFKQEVDLAGSGLEGNPARVESSLLYGQAHPQESAPYDIDKINHYWKQQFVDHVLENPLDLAKLWGFKIYAVLNANEQYNNFTFSFHKSRLPLLRFNPLNWGYLLILATIGALALYRSNRPMLWTMVLFILCYSLTLVLYYASARFRLPLVPLLAVLSGGAILQIKEAVRSRNQLTWTLPIALVTGIITFSCFGSVCKKDTYVQDRILLANAYTETGDDKEAARNALEVLQEFPKRKEAQRIYTISYFNLRLLQLDGTAQFGDWATQAPLVIQRPPTDPVQDAVLGVYFWNWGFQKKAIDIWKHIANQSNSGTVLAKACLESVNRENSENQMKIALDRILIPANKTGLNE
jgi:hypothetical protein